MTCNTRIPKSKSSAISVDGVTDTFGSRPSNMEIWLVSLLCASLTHVYLGMFLLIDPSLRIDCRFQEPDRLDPPLNRQCASDSRSHTGRCDGLGRFTVVQHCQQPTYPRSMDANVCHPKSVFDSQSIYRLHRGRRPRRRIEAYARRQPRSCR